jgi:hypothetical protein
VWNDSRDDQDLFGTRLDTNGNHVDEADVLVGPNSRAGQSYNLDLVWGQGRFSLAYHTDETIAGRFLDSALTELAPGALNLSPVPNQQDIPTAIWTGSTYVLGWTDERVEMANQFRMVEIDAAGTVLDPMGVLLSTPEQRVGSGAVAFNGQTILYTWNAWGDAPASYKRTQRLDGPLSEPEMWLTDSQASSPVSNGQTFMALSYAGDNGDGNENEIWGHRFDADGTVAGEAFLIQTISRPRAGLWPLGDEFLLAFSGQEVSGTPIAGKVMTINGQGEITAEYEPVQDGMLTAAAGTNDDAVLFSWQDDESGALWARLFSKVDGWREPFVLTDQVGWGTPAICWNGSEFVVVWSEDEVAAWARNVSANGAMTEPERLFDGNVGWPLLTPGAEGQMLLSYLSWNPIEYRRRVRSRIVGSLSEGMPDVVSSPSSGGSGPTNEPIGADPEGTPAGGPPAGGTGPEGLPETPGPGAPAVDPLMLLALGSLGTPMVPVWTRVAAPTTRVAARWAVPLARASAGSPCCWQRWLVVVVGRAQGIPCCKFAELRSRTPRVSGCNRNSVDRSGFRARWRSLWHRSLAAFP